MEWDKALADLLLEEPEIRSWLALDPSTHDESGPRQVDRPPTEAPQPALAA